VSRTAVLGAGSWGTALAVHLAARAASAPAGSFATVLWARREEAAGAMRRDGENRTHLPGCALPRSLEVTSDLEAAMRGSDVVLCVTPAQHSRDLYRRLKPLVAHRPDLVIASKGIEQGSGRRLDEVMREEIGDGASVAILSGPSFALEVARGAPAAVVVASRDPAAARRAQARLSHGRLRLYTNGDPAGVALSGALKNVMAIATGIGEGIGLGLNARAALLTRGLAEITRLGVAAGGRPATFAGLAGMGDLVLTCTGDLSRNRALGIAVGRGASLASVLAATASVVEGVPTTRAALALAARLGVDLPIAAKVEEVLHGGRAPLDAVEDLLARPLRDEEDG
jgi:glycerol-3-phosphate dehydrogenase (NAD(P)+)